MVEANERHIAPWIWVMIVLLAIILVFVIWWVVAAQSPRTVVIVPGPSQPTTPPTQQPSPPSGTAQPPQPVVVQPQTPVNIYVQDRQPSPKVIIVPRDQQPPPSAQGATQVTLPGAFKYQGKTWTASDEAITSSTAKLKDIGATVDGNPLYAGQGAEPPHDTLYLETSPGSGIFLKYE